MSNQLENDKICKLCLGCGRLEDYDFKGMCHCNDFVPAYDDWQKIFYERLRKNGM